MKQVYLVLLISTFAIVSAFAGIPDDADLLLWIGEGSGNKAVAMNNGAEGIIDEISFWERALNENEIQNLMDVSLDVEAVGKLAVTWGELKKTNKPYLCIQIGNCNF